MSYIITDENQVCEYQKIERNLFNLDFFNPNYVVFPKQVFKKRFDKIYFLKYNDWFHSVADYNRLISFIEDVNSKSFIASCPPFNLLNAIEVPINSTFKDYIDNHAYSNWDGHKLQGVGIRKSAETFYYDKSERWAFVSDFVHNIIFVGINKELVPIYKNIFSELSSDLETFIVSLENFQGNKMDNREEVIETYSK